MIKDIVESFQRRKKVLEEVTSYEEIRDLISNIDRRRLDLIWGKFSFNIFINDYFKTSDPEELVWNLDRILSSEDFSMTVEGTYFECLYSLYKYRNGSEMHQIEINRDWRFIPEGVHPNTLGIFHAHIRYKLQPEINPT